MYLNFRNLISVKLKIVNTVQMKKTPPIGKCLTKIFTVQTVYNTLVRYIIRK